MTEHDDTGAADAGAEPVGPEFNARVKRPPLPWRLVGGDGQTCEGYAFGDLLVVSRVGRKKDSNPPEYFFWLEITKAGGRPTDKQCARVCKAFGMKRSQETKGPGPSRHFMLSVPLN